MDSHGIPKPSCVDAMEGYLLVHGKHWKDSKSISLQIPSKVPHWIPKHSSMKSMGGYILAHSIQWEDAC